MFKAALTMGLAREAFKSGGWVGLSNGLIAIVQLVQFSLLSRFFTPAEFGLIALLMAVYFLGISTINAGFGSGIIAIPNVSVKQYSSLFWLNLIVGVITFMLLYAVSPLLSAYFKTPALIKPLQMFTFIFLLIPLGQQFEYLLQKNMQFRAVSIADFTATCLEAVVCLWLAAQGYGIDAFVVGKLSYFAFRSLTFFYIGLKRYPPQLYLSLKEIQPFIHFGIFQLGSNSMFVLYSQMPKLIIPPLLGLDVMGYYELADRITMQPLLKILPIIKKVALPVMAKVQEDLERVRKGYRYYLLSIEMIMAPITMIIALFSEELVLLIFGSEWVAIIPYVKILIVATFIRCISDTAAMLALATKRSDLDFYRSVFILGASFLLLYGGVASFGAIGAVWAILVVNIASLFFGYFVIAKQLLHIGSMSGFYRNAAVLSAVTILSLTSIPMSGMLPAFCLLLVFSLAYYLLRSQDIRALVAQIIQP